MTVKEVYDIISNIYDLTDLMTRPLLLGMFVEILFKGDIDLEDADLKMGAAGLYQIYVNLHLFRDWKKRQFLSPKERLIFARAAAVSMLEAGENLQARFSSIVEVVNRGRNYLDENRQNLI